MAHQKKLKGPLLVVVHFCMPVQLGCRGELREQRHLMPFDQRPDSDNLEKFVNDCMNNVVWLDDCQIVWLLKSKLSTKDKIGKTIFYVTEIPDSKPDYAALLKILSERIDVDANDVPDTV